MSNTAKSGKDARGTWIMRVMKNAAAAHKTTPTAAALMIRARSGSDANCHTPRYRRSTGRPDPE